MSGLGAGGAQIAIVADGVYHYDAISDALAETYRFLTDGTGWQVSIFACENHRTDIPVARVQLPEMLLDRRFGIADLVIYHFGIWSPLFDALLLREPHRRQAVYFHNLTPAELMPPQDRYLIDRSLVQIHNLRHADRLWPVSRTNAEFLDALDFDPERIEIMPLAVDSPEIATLADKPASPIEVVFLSRIVPHKGVRDLLAALDRLRGRGLPPFRLKVLGNLFGSDRAYTRSVRQLIAERELDGIVEFLGTVTDRVRDETLRAAHILAIPSYHEGFCKPAIEALRAGCIPVGYAAHNLRYIADGLGRMVAPGDIDALAEALAQAIADAHAAIRDPAARLRLDRGDLSAAEFAPAARTHVEQFRSAHIADLTRRQAARLLA